MADGSRRFPRPWRAEPIPGGYVVRDANGQALAYLYSRDNDAEARQAKVLTKDEARRIAIKHRAASCARAVVAQFDCGGLSEASGISSRQTDT
jgi:hypothetical protein